MPLSQAARISLCLLFAWTASCSNGSSGPSASTGSQPPKESGKKTFTMNKEAKGIVANGNVPIAIEMFDSALAQGKPMVAPASANTLANLSEISKKPFSAMGQFYKLRGEVYKVEELPPGTANSPNAWGEVLILAGNKNSPMGVTSIDYMFQGDIAKINSGTVVEVTGVFIGTFDSANAMGGQVEALVFAGNSVKTLH